MVVQAERDVQRQPAASGRLVAGRLLTPLIIGGPILGAAIRRAEREAVEDHEVVAARPVAAARLAIDDEFSAHRGLSRISTACCAGNVACIAAEGGARCWKTMERAIGIEPTTFSLGS